MIAKFTPTLKKCSLDDQIKKNTNLIKMVPLVAGVKQYHAFLLFNLVNTTLPLKMVPLVTGVK